jgi:hypothetical protein
MQSGYCTGEAKTRVVEQKQLTKGKAALLLMLSALGAIASATWLHGWQMYVGFAVVGIGIFIGFTIWNRKH